MSHDANTVSLNRALQFVKKEEGKKKKQSLTPKISLIAIHIQYKLIKCDFLAECSLKCLLSVGFHAGNDSAESHNSSCSASKPQLNLKWLFSQVHWILNVFLVHSTHALRVLLNWESQLLPSSLLCPFCLFTHTLTTYGVFLRCLFSLARRLRAPTFFSSAARVASVHNSTSMIS